MAKMSQDRAWKDYSERFRREVMPRLLSSSIFVGVYNRTDDAGPEDIQFATSLGLMLLHGKPIVLMALPGVELPPALLRIADEVIVGDPTDAATQDAIATAIRRVTDRLDRERGA